MVARPRGELAELENVLGTLQKSDRNKPDVRASKRQVFQKMIGYMTVGMDMSTLMPKVISAANLSPDDLLLKKMMYLYLCTYAKQNPDLALMAISQLQKDCKDTDPSVRGLALRSLCSLRVTNLLEYVVDPIVSGLQDRHPYVVKTAVMGVLKVHHLDDSVAEMRGLVDQLRVLLLDAEDPGVLGNCVSVLAAIEAPSKLSTKPIVYKLLNKVKESSEWLQCQALEVVSHYRPQGENEVFDIMNVLEDRLTSTNSALVLAVIKVFLFLTINMPATHQQVLERIREPLRMIISRDNAGVTYTVLLHILFIAQRAPVMFSEDYATFYCRTDDPMYVKRVKMDILTVIADNSNAYEIVSELTEYVRDINPAMAKEAVAAVGRVALVVPDVSGIVERLINFLESADPDIVAETLVQMKDLLRRYPDMSEVCLPSLNDIVPSTLGHTPAKAAFIWILGQHGERIEDAPYILESIVEEYATEDPSVRLALITAATKLFFKRAPECQKLVGSVLSYGVNDENQDVHDKALLYYRLLRHNVHEAEKIIAPALPTVSDFAEEMTSEMKDRIFDEFNSLSIVYQAPASTFVDKESGVFQEEVEMPATAATPPADSESTLLAEKGPSTEADLLDMGMSNSSAAADNAASTTAGGGLLDLDDLLGGASAAPAPLAPRINLRPEVTITAPVFQGFWRDLSESTQFTQALRPLAMAALPQNNHQSFCQHMKSGHIQTMASGGGGALYKYYFYAQPMGSPSVWFLVEMIANTASREARITIKSQDAQTAAGQFADYFKSHLNQFMP
ncbi:hypothetical protein BSKO_07566 [Bryopsis sp. KO-2023]|nr:hypothetical protein BSKO_07566 [Bryopsis sp. KO-2023]